MTSARPQRPVRAPAVGTQETQTTKEDDMYIGIGTLILIILILILIF